jgi:hypothetical protein
VELCGSRDREVVRRVRLSVTRLAARGLAETWTSNGRDGWAGNPDFWERHRVRRNGSTFTQFTPRVRWAALPGQRPTLDLPTMDDLAAVVGVAR